MKTWQYLIYMGIYFLGIIFILASIGALIEIQLLDFGMFLILGVITISISLIVESYFEENSPEKHSMESLDLL